jgi:hypothetical protein
LDFGEAGFVRHEGHSWYRWVLPALALVGVLAAYAVWRGWQTPETTHLINGDAASPGFFRDVTAESGLHFTYRNGQEANHYSILESLGGGVALIDYDGDGLLDIFVTGGGYFDGPDKKQIKGHPCRMYKNLGGWKFKDVTQEVGLDGISFYSHGCAVADYDRDGWPDLLVTGYGRLALFRNVPGENGGRRFVEVTREAGLIGEHFWSTSAAFADLDGDGYPELYVCQYVDWSFANNPACEGGKDVVEPEVCPPRFFGARAHALYRNNGNSTFTDVTKEAGLHAPRSDTDYDKLEHLSPQARDSLRKADREKDFGKGLGVVIVDVNGDGKPDIYVANDTTDKFLYINRSTPGKFRFEDMAVDLGAARDESGAPNGSMGVDAGDYDGSGRPSLLVTNYQDELHALYRSVLVHGRTMFQFNSPASGLGTIGRHYVGFGAGFLDVDNDGWLDIVITNGHVTRHPMGTGVRQLPVLLRNEGRLRGQPDVRFTSITSRAGDYFRTVHLGRGLAIGDLDNDGRPDLVISQLNEPVTLLRNEAAPDNHWLGVQLADKTHRDLVGAKVTLEVNDRLLTRFMTGGGSYLSSSDHRLLFGLGTADKVGPLTVTWPTGQFQSWDGLAIDRYWLITAGEKMPKELPNGIKANHRTS